VANSDDSPVPEYLWDHTIIDDLDPLIVKEFHALGVLWNFAFYWWKHHVMFDFLHWFHLAHPNGAVSLAAKRDLMAGQDCVTRVPKIHHRNGGCNMKRIQRPVALHLNNTARACVN
jgi:hypothetical protein